MENDFINGLFFKKPSEKAPQFIKGKLSIKKIDFITWLNEQDVEWVNIDLLESKKGTYYAKVDEWKPNQEGLSQSDKEEIKNAREQHNSGFDNINNDNSEISVDQIPF